MRGELADLTLTDLADLTRPLGRLLAPLLTPPGERRLLFIERREEAAASLDAGGRRGETVRRDAGAGLSRWAGGDRREAVYAYRAGLDIDLLRPLEAAWRGVDAAAGPAPASAVEMASAVDARRALADGIGARCQVWPGGDVERVAVDITARRQDIAVFDWRGGAAVDCRRAVTVNVAVDVASRGRRARATRRLGADRFDADPLLARLDVAVAQAAAAARRKLAARRLPAGRYPVVLAPGIGALVLHEAVAHALEGDFVDAGVSMFCGRLGDRVAPEAVTVIDSAREPDQKSSYRVDDEGNPARSTTLIEAGRLVSLIHSADTAAAAGIASTGNGRRESFRYPALPRATCTALRPGARPAHEVLRRVSRGVYVANLGGGQADVSGGPFQFVATEAFLIEDGRVADPLVPVSVSGLGRDYLDAIIELGDDFAYEPGGGGPCVKGQTVEVSFGQPTVLMERLMLSEQP